MNNCLLGEHESKEAMSIHMFVLLSDGKNVSRIEEGYTGKCRGWRWSSEPGTWRNSQPALEEGHRRRVRMRHCWLAAGAAGAATAAAAAEACELTFRLRRLHRHRGLRPGHATPATPPRRRHEALTFETGHACRKERRRCWSLWKKEE